MSSLSVSFYSARQSQAYSEIAIRPILITGGAVFEGDDGVIFVGNRGVGSAEISKVVFQIDGIEVSSNDIGAAFIAHRERFIKGRGITTSCTLAVGGFFEGMYIPPNERVAVFISDGACPSELYAPFMKILSVLFVYKSQSGNEYQMEFGTAKDRDELIKRIPFF